MPRGCHEPQGAWKGEECNKAWSRACARDAEDWKLMNILFGERQTLRAEGKGLLFKEPTLFDALRKSSREG